MQGEDGTGAGGVRRGSPEALALYQRHIDFLTECLFQNDADRFLERVSFPHHIQNVDASIITRNPSEFRDLFRKVHDGLRGDGVTQMVRYGVWAEFLSENEILGEHRTELLRGSVRAVQPFLNRLHLLRSADGVWQETACANAIRFRAGKIGLLENPDAEYDIPVLKMHTVPS